MNCAEFDNELQNRLDRGAIEDTHAMRKHRRNCVACDEAWDRARLLADAIVAWRELLPDIDLVDATLCDWIATDASQKHASASDNRTRAPLGRRSLEPTADRTRGVGRRNRWTLVSVVAGLVALVAVSVYLPFGDPGPTSEPAADLTQVEPQTPAMGSTNLGVREAALLNQAGAAYGTLARSAAGAIEEFAWIMIPGRPMSPADAENDPAEGRWIDGLQHQLQPIGKSLGDAFDFLWEVGRPPDDTRT